MSWFAIISTIVLSLVGKSVITQKYSLLLQIIFMHVYIYTEYLPVNFMIVIGGLSRMQNLDYFSREVSEKIEGWLLGNVVQGSPFKFTMFAKDINFTRSVYPSIIAILFYLVIFILLNLIRKLINTSTK
jgi:hypothetical protein